MTRSLGDLYAHHHGVIPTPTIATFDLAALPPHMAGPRAPLLLLASDGVWDLWSFDEVAEQLVPGGPGCLAAETLQGRAALFCEVTRQKGAEYFDEYADNLTGILVDLTAPSASRAISTTLPLR